MSNRLLLALTLALSACTLPPAGSPAPAPLATSKELGPNNLPSGIVSDGTVNTPVTDVVGVTHGIP